MNRAFAPWCLLAQRNRLDDLTSRFRGDNVRFEATDALLLLSCLGGLILLLWLISVLITWQEKGCRRASPTRLFFRLARAHKLSWSDVWLLWRLAKLQRVSDPGRIFLEPDRFDPVHLAEPLRRHRRRLETLREKLFAHSAEPPREGHDPTWDLPHEERLSTPLSPITPAPRLPL